MVLSGGPHPPLERALLPAPGHIAAHDQQPALDGTADARDFAGNSARNASLHRLLQKLQAGDSPAFSVWGLAAYLAAKFKCAMDASWQLSVQIRPTLTCQP